MGETEREKDGWRERKGEGKGKERLIGENVGEGGK